MSGSYYFIFSGENSSSLSTSTSAAGHVPLHGLAHHVTCLFESSVYNCYSNAAVITVDDAQLSYSYQIQKYRAVLFVILDNLDIILEFFDIILDPGVVYLLFSIIE